MQFLRVDMAQDGKMVKDIILNSDEIKQITVKETFLSIVMVCRAGAGSGGSSMMGGSMDFDREEHLFDYGTQEEAIRVYLDLWAKMERL